MRLPFQPHQRKGNPKVPRRPARRGGREWHRPWLPSLCRAIRPLPGPRYSPPWAKTPSQLQALRLLLSPYSSGVLPAGRWRACRYADWFGRQIPHPRQTPCAATGWHEGRVWLPREFPLEARPARRSSSGHRNRDGFQQRRRRVGPYIRHLDARHQPQPAQHAVSVPRQPLR